MIVKKCFRFSNFVELFSLIILVKKIFKSDREIANIRPKYWYTPYPRKKFLKKTAFQRVYFFVDMFSLDV